MEYQKIINLLDDTTNQPSKFRTRNWVEINDESRGAYNDDNINNNNDDDDDNNNNNNNNNDNNNIKFKTSMVRSSLCDYSDVYILVKRTITVSNGAVDAAVNNTNKKVMFKNCALFTSCITEINNTQVDNVEDIDIVIPMYNLIEHSNAYSKTSGNL